VGRIESDTISLTCADVSRGGGANERKTVVSWFLWIIVKMSLNFVRFQVLTVASMKKTAFCDIVPCSNLKVSESIK
jgi:hypothetical protein